MGSVRTSEVSSTKIYKRIGLKNFFQATLFIFCLHIGQKSLIGDSIGSYSWNRLYFFDYYRCPERYHRYETCRKFQSSE
jgi:hypothetical protein